MLYPLRVIERLEASTEQFRSFAEDQATLYRVYGAALGELERLSGPALAERLDGAARPGATPSEEWSNETGFVLPFGAQFAHHRAAREWALERIAGVATVSVDGSEIKPSKDYSLPIAAIQIGWFENPHRSDGHYIKDVAFEVIHPEELFAERGDGFGIADQQLALRRFIAEIDKLVERIQSWGQTGWSGAPPVAFFDGSLVVSFATAMLADLGGRYIAAICRLLAASEEAMVPVVGYIDTSMAKDLGAMLAVLGGLERADRVPDSRLLDRRLKWGDRTRALVCRRDDILRQYLTAEGRDFSEEVCFVYLKTNAAAPPARLDLPRWIVRAGLTDHVVDVVRSEVIVGNGYPYCIEAADACAVLGSADRERFYRLLQDFARRHHLALQIAPKAASKRRRRA